MKTRSIICIMLFLIRLCSTAQASDALPAMGAVKNGTSVSGLSSGGFMAEQYQVAYSASVVGSGIVAAGPYYCSLGNFWNTFICMGTYPYFLPYSRGLLELAEVFASEGKIDPLSNLRNRRVYVFSGTNDKKVFPRTVDTTVEFFREAGVLDVNLAYVKNIPSGHALVTPGFGNDCDANLPPYISHCLISGKDYDQPGEILMHIYGKLNPPVKKRSSNILAFNQREFSQVSTSMAAEAFVYIPVSCINEASCKVHVAFHGCKQSATPEVASAFYDKSSYNDWADSNNIIVLYPQVEASLPLNEDGCWDWYGYTGPDYAYKSGPQLKAVYQMIERLTSQR